jgi:serine/threonine protein kinase
MLLAPNLVVADRFQLQRPIGKGGMGSVWLARHMGLYIPCAVKFIEGSYATMPEAQARFVREAKAAAQLRSPHVVQILDHGVWQGMPYMAMELLEGEDLGKRIQKVGRLPPAEVCRIVGQVARALTKAHGAGIVHRDLKPDNVFLVRDDDREIAKVLDFGIAKAQTALDGGNTKTGAMLGTPYYMSPEQAQGVKAVDHRSDLWSLAVIVYVMLTGRLPFDSEALGDLLLKIIVQPMPVPSQVAPDLPPAFDRWWATAANRDPSQRYGSAKEMSDALAVVLGVSMSAVTDKGHSGAGYGGDSQNRVPWAVAHALTPGPSVPTMPVTPQPYPTPNPHQPPVLGSSGSMPMGTGAPIAHTFGGLQPPPKSRAGLFVGIAAAVVVVVGGLGIGAAVAMRPKPAAANAPPAAETVPAATTAAASVAAATPSASDTAPAASAEVLAPPADTRPEAKPAATATAPVTTGAAVGGRPHPPAFGTAHPEPGKPAPPKKQNFELGI